MSTTGITIPGGIDFEMLSLFMKRNYSLSIHSLTQAEVDFVSNQRSLPFFLAKAAKMGDLMMKNSE